jgi:hypothetical protein
VGLEFSAKGLCKKNAVSGVATSRMIICPPFGILTLFDTIVNIATTRFPPACQGSPGTEDTGYLQNPLRVRQSLHWANGPFCGHQVKRTSTAFTPRTS